MAVGSGGGVDVDVLVQLGEHGARLASFEVEDELVVHLLFMHGIQSLVEVISVEVAVDDSNQTDGTVIREVDENVVVFSALEDLLATGGGGITGKGSKEVSWGDIFAGVVNLDTSINVLAVWLVEDLTLVWVGVVVSDIIISESDDVIFMDTILLQDLISVEDIRLMAVVSVAVGTGDQDSPSGC